MRETVDAIQEALRLVSVDNLADESKLHKARGALDKLKAEQALNQQGEQEPVACVMADPTEPGCVFARLHTKGEELPVGTQLYTLPQPATIPVTVSLGHCLVGARGSAYDLPDTARAYTYNHQPGNLIASKLGRVSRADRSGGDDIDYGLAFLRQLQEEGFGVFQLAAAPEQPKEADSGEE